jgi:hypothetical protein
MCARQREETGGSAQVHFTFASRRPLAKTVEGRREMLNIFELLSQGTIVAWDEEKGLIVLWNTNLTLRLFRGQPIELNNGNNIEVCYALFEEIECFVMNERETRYSKKFGAVTQFQKITLKRATKEAQKWLERL